MALSALAVLLIGGAVSPILAQYNPGPVPLNWTTQYECAVDIPSGVIIDPGLVTTLSNNTVAACVTLCDGDDYEYAGVENGSECICGNQLVSNITSAPVTDCSAPCAGDASLSCGGSSTLQVLFRHSTSMVNLADNTCRSINRQPWVARGS